MRWYLGAIAILAAARPAAAQECYGNPSLEESSRRVGALVDLALSDPQYQSFQGNLMLSREARWFGIATAGYTNQDVTEGGLVVGADVGYAGFRPVGGKIRLCPFAGVLHDRSFGPATDFRLGVMAGYDLTGENASTPLVLTAGYTGIYQRYQLGGDFGSAEEWYGIVDAALAIRLGRNLVVAPGGRIYVRFSGGRDPSLVLRASAGF